MGKKRIEEMLPFACRALKDCEILKDNKVPDGMRGQVSAFGAAITMGSLAAAVAFYSRHGDAEVEREKIPPAIFNILRDSNMELGDYSDLKALALARHADPQLRAAVIDAATALKLAINFYEKDDSKKGGTQA